MRVNCLDVLKAIAIIAVVLYHSGFATFGYLGVDVFLVISGYVTTKSLYSKLLNNRLIRGGTSTLNVQGLSGFFQLCWWPDLSVCYSAMY